jgi:hypothetical protein
MGCHGVSCFGLAAYLVMFHYESTSLYLGLLPDLQNQPVRIGHPWFSSKRKTCALNEKIIALPSL